MINYIFDNLLECITECTDYQPMDKVAACAYVCEMTHGYENAEFLENMNCLIDGQCLPQYPDDGICYGQDSDGIESITSMDQVSVLVNFLSGNSTCFLLRLKVIGGSSEDSIVDMETFREVMIGTLANTNDSSSRKVANGSIM